MVEFKKFEPVGRWELEPSGDAVQQTPGLPAHLVELSARIRNSRSQRREHFRDEMFGEAAWEILLALYIAQGRGYRLKVSDACFESGAPSTTALRWLDHLLQSNLVVKRTNFLDGRSSHVELTAEGVARMNRYLAAVDESVSRKETQP